MATNTNNNSSAGSQIMQDLMQASGSNWPIIPASSDPRTVNFAYYVTVYSINVGLTNGVEASLQNILSVQAALNDLTGDISNFVTALNNLKALDPTQATTAQIAALVTQMHNSLVDIFGAHATWSAAGGLSLDFADDKNAALVKYIDQMQQTNGPSWDYTKDSIFQNCSQLFGDMSVPITGPVYVPGAKPGSGTWTNPTTPSTTFITDLMNQGAEATQDLQAMLANFWLGNGHSVSGVSPGPEDYLTVFSGDGSSAQQTSGTVSNQNLALQQQYNTTESSIDQNVQQIISSVGDSINTMVTSQQTRS